MIDARSDCTHEAELSSAPVECTPATVPHTSISELRLTETPASASYATHTRKRTRLLIAEQGRPLWNYTDDVQLLKGFADILKGFEDLKTRRLNTTTSPSPAFMRLSEDSSGNPAGWSVDLDIARNSSSIYDSPPLHFMPRDDLCHIVNTGTVPYKSKTPEEAEAANAESLEYILAYAIFRRSIACAARARNLPGMLTTLNAQVKRRHTQTNTTLNAELVRTFESLDVQSVLANRDAAGPFAWVIDARGLACGIQWLLAQLHEKHATHYRNQANMRACAFLASMDDHDGDEGNEDASVFPVNAPAQLPYSYMSLHMLAHDALLLVEKMPDIPSPCEDVFPKETRELDCCVQ